MAKFDRLVITGGQRADIDVSAVARVIIMVARRWLRRSLDEPQQPATHEEDAS